GIVADQPLAEHPPVALMGLLGLGEVFGEVLADKLGAGVAGDGLGGLVHVGDLAVGADGDQGVEAGLEQAAVVSAGPPQRLLRALPRGDVSAGPDPLAHTAVRLEHRRAASGEVAVLSIALADPILGLVNRTGPDRL